MYPFQENGNISAFLGKLWKMVNDSSTDHIISWNETGNSFIIHNQAQFWYEMLPVYYKHNNMSSFVRQLNMYGFHKITSLENASLSSAQKSDSQSIQFYHPYFQKDEPEKLKEIKRKVAKPNEGQQPIIIPDYLKKALTDVKQLRGRQSSVDSQLSAMKQENAVLWRELAILRQKHIKQQQIVNKVLIQFLVTLVQPSPQSRMGVGVKRRMPLMLHEHSLKKTRGSKKNGLQNIDPGPTIHELDSDTDLFPEQLLDEASSSIEEIPLEMAVSNMDKPNKIDSPITPSSQGTNEGLSAKPVSSPASSNQSDVATSWQQNESALWDESDFAALDDEVTENEELINSLQKNRESEKVFLNPNSRDALIGNLLNTETYNAIAGKPAASSNNQVGDPVDEANMKVAKKESNVNINTDTRSTNAFRTDLDLHVDSTQTELDQLKDILNGCSTFDPSTLLGLFSENESQYGIKNTILDKENPAEEEEDFPDLIDVRELNNEVSNPEPDAILSASNSGLNTPIIVKNAPIFPNKGE
ncbi:heat shock factor protein isoform X1 [Dendroctonus ponderosae]|uniref:HSF-type DNA-binding domain-containing protein n=1 Tax=Dendroctonus ponderosae TaxID=77166 RepID=A0AAR5NXJ7_DENPD|nr:heat shock factor protein isoform X1 [Dendroctonus ponderosae]